MLIALNAAASSGISVGGGHVVSKASTDTARHSGPAFKSKEVKSSGASDARPMKTDHILKSSGPGVEAKKSEPGVEAKSSGPGVEAKPNLGQHPGAYEVMPSKTHQSAPIFEPGIAAKPAFGHQVSPFDLGTPREPKKSTVIDADKHKVFQDDVALVMDKKQHTALLHKTKSDIKQYQTDVASNKQSRIAHDLKAMASDRHSLLLNQDKTVADKETKKVDVAKLKADLAAVA